MNSKKVISIIGGGAVGIALLNQIIDKNISKYKFLNLEINVFEKRSQIGPGLSYGDDARTNLLNRPAETMSAVVDEPDHFIRWLRENKSWNRYYSFIDHAKLEGEFLPRPLFGLYLQDLARLATEKAKKYKITVNVVHEEVFDIHKQDEDFLITTNHDKNYISHYVVLALGHVQSNHYDHLKVSSKYYESPYPTKNLSKAIPNNASVAILGSRLSAIDAVISLHANGHFGNVAFISRHGYMPSIRPAHILDHDLKVLNSTNLLSLTRNKKQPLKLKQLSNLIADEVSLITGRKRDFSEWFNRAIDPIEYVTNELTRVNSNDFISWQSVLIAMNNEIELIWDLLQESDKSIFIKKYRSRWMAYRVGIPYQNAELVLKLLQNGLLRSVSGLNEVKYDLQKDVYSVHLIDGTVREYDYVINATGSCSDISSTQSVLIKNLKLNGLINKNEFGGIQLSFNTSNIINTRGAVENNMYAVGNLTEGVYFFTSVLELNIRHTKKIASSILNTIGYGLMMLKCGDGEAICLQKNTIG